MSVFFLKSEGENMNNQEKKVKIYQIIFKNLKNLIQINEGKLKSISKNDNLVDDLGFDSLDISEVLVDTEMIFGIEITQDLMQNPPLKTIDDLINIVDLLTTNDDVQSVSKLNCRLKKDNKCCCNCNNRWQDFYHHSTGEGDKEQKGWACVIVEDKKIYSQLTEHGICGKYSRNKNL